MQAKAVWRFLEVESEGDAINLFEPGKGIVLHRFDFPRQSKRRGLCLADFVSSKGPRDSVAVFVVTAGVGIRDHADRAKAGGEYLKSHALHALGLEMAEAAAECLHSKIRASWGFPDPPGLSMRDRFAGRYRGKRFSPGYPACPNLDDQKALFEILHPEDIGVRLTDGMMMEPEASVSAIVFHHPEARYFSVLGDGSVEGIS